MRAIKEFITAAEKTLEEEGQTKEFKIDDEVYTYYDPDPTQLALLMASFGRHGSEVDRIAGVIDFFVGVLDERSHNELVRRLLDRKDALGINQVQEIIEWMMEDWSGRPTDSPSVSTGSQQNGGRKSTPRIPASKT